MSYNIDSDAIASEVPEIALLRANNSDVPLTTSSVITFQDNISNVTHNGISSGMALTAAGLTLGVGHWQLQAFLGTDNDDDLANNVKYLWYKDGVGVGVHGITEMSGYTNTNSADCLISVDEGTVDVELKFVVANVLTSIVLLPGYSPVVIWKVS